MYFKGRRLESDLGATDFHIGQILRDILAVRTVIIAGSKFRQEIAAVQACRRSGVGVPTRNLSCPSLRRVNVDVSCACQFEGVTTPGLRGCQLDLKAGGEEMTSGKA